MSWDLDTEWAEFVQFYLRVGGDWAECNQADSREEGVLLQYSNDGGISWGLIAEMYFTDFTKPRYYLHATILYDSYTAILYEGLHCNTVLGLHCNTVRGLHCKTVRRLNCYTV